MEDRDKLVDFALSQIGVHEEPLGSNRQKYGEYLDKTVWYLYKENGKTWIHKVNGFDWCTSFVDACFNMVFGLDKAREMLFRPVYNNYGAVVKYAYGYFEKEGTIVQNPRRGDVIYFQRSGSLSHTGIIVDVIGDTLTVVEGNAGKNNSYVVMNKYKTTDSYVYGFGRPAYAASKYPDTPFKAKCTLNGVAIRSGPYSDSPIIGYVHKDDVLTIEDLDGSSGDFGLIHGYVYIPGGFEYDN